MKMTNCWIRTIYRLWAPVYDATVDRFFAPGRRRAMDVLNLKAGERVLLLGVGTGADLPLLPRGVQAVGIDLSPEMLARARRKLPLPGREVTLLQGDAQQLSVDAMSFDALILNLILSVVPDGNACLRVAMQALKHGGRAVIFDKFLPDQGRLTLGRRCLNFFSTLLGTDINRRFSEILSNSPGTIVHQEPSLLRGMYQVILLRHS